MEDAQSSAPALARGLQLMELISKEGDIGFNEIVEKSGFNVSSVNRLLKVLVEYGYVMKNNKSKYTIGIKLISLAQKDTHWQPLIHATASILKELSDDFGCTALLIGFARDSMLCLDKHTNPENISMISVGDITKDFTVRPWGLLYLATLPKAQQAQLIMESSKYASSKNTIPSQEELEEYFRFIKAQDYCDDKGIILKKVRRVAVPIYTSHKDMIGALAVGSYIELWPKDKEKTLIEYLNLKSKEISNLY